MPDLRIDLLNRIRALEFMTVELTLFLDTHPDDQRALSEYNYYTRQLMGLKNEYERRYGPLTHYGYASSSYPWRWIEEPWPWEQDFMTEE